jgi:NADPH-dependent 2,4-dienoyl-CoA reductase/sulfur reductase-like enzyme
MSSPAARTERVCVVVGASLAGLRACEGLRRGGYAGPVVVIGAESDGPYNRPPLSKAELTVDGHLEPDLFRVGPALADIEWRLGEAVTRADLTEDTVTTDSGDVVPWTGLVVATGLRPRRLDLPGPTLGRAAIRTIADARQLRSSLVPGASVVIVGAGFIGCELAMTIGALGVSVHVVDPLELPMERQLGGHLATVVQQQLLAAGVTLHLGVAPTAYLGGAAVEAVGLSDGSLVPATTVVEAVGSVPNTEWLAGNGLDVTDGVACDEQLRAGGRPDVFACGDVARFPHPLQTGTPRRMEHWTMAGDTGRHAGRALARHLNAVGVDDRPGDPDDAFAPMPSFWSDLGDLRLQSFGLPAEGMGDVRVLEGKLGGEVAVGYHREGALVGVVLLGLGQRYQLYRSRVAETLLDLQKGVTAMAGLIGRSL